MSSTKTRLKCWCKNSYGKCENGTCEISADGGHCFYILTSEANAEVHEVSQGCTNPLNCHDPLYSYEWPKINFCCNRDFCNVLPSNITEPRTKISSTKSHSLEIHLGLAMLFGVFFLSLTALFAVWYWKRRPKTDHKENCGDKTSIIPAVSKQLVDQSEQSALNLAQRCMTNDVSVLKEQLGKGGFGVVYRAEWMSMDVAIKVFFPNCSSAWEKEMEVYKHLNKSSHPNILRSVGNGYNPDIAKGEIWLITEYCDGGSLSNYLNNQPIPDVDTCFQMCADIAGGLVHLHKEINMLDDIRPAIAHRDLKPTNILLRKGPQDRMTCVIGDFGLAVVNVDEAHKTKSTAYFKSKQQFESRRNDPDANVDLSKWKNAGTARYMSPEALSGSLTNIDFQKLKQSDMYSFGLVLWEIAARTIIDLGLEDCALRIEAYDSYLNGCIPMPDKMRYIVCYQKKRPPMLDTWRHCPRMILLAGLIQECWKEDPNNRLSARHVQKQLRGESTT